MLACRLQLLSPHDFEAPDLTTLRYVISLGLGSSSSQWTASHSRSTGGGPATCWSPVVTKKNEEIRRIWAKLSWLVNLTPMKMWGYLGWFDFENWWGMILDCGLGEINGRCYAFGRFKFGRAPYSKIRFEIRDLLRCLFVNVHYLNMFRYQHMNLGSGWLVVRYGRKVKR